MDAFSIYMLVSIRNLGPGLLNDIRSLSLAAAGAMDPEGDCMPYIAIRRTIVRLHLSIQRARRDRINIKSSAA